MRVINLLGAVSAVALLAACSDVETSPAPDAGTDIAVDAATPQTDPLPPADADVLFQGVRRLVERLDAPEGLSVTASGTGARLSGGPAAAEARPAGVRGGAMLRLPAALERFASGGRVRVTISARAIGPAGSEAFAANYTTRDVGNSEWISFALVDHFETHVFEYDVPLMDEGRGDFVGILPDASGAGRAMEVAFVAVEVLQAGPAAAAEN